jgi:hypothetical protein
MVKELKKRIEELSDKARELEQWLYDNTEDPSWFAKISEYNNVLFDLAQKNEQLSNEGHEVTYRQTAYLPRHINRSENVKR